MNAPVTHRSLELSQKLYKRLLAAYPRSHREAYGGAMAQLFRDQCRDAWAEGRAWGLVTLWLRILPDLMKTSFLERCANFKPGKYMTTKMNSMLPNSRGPIAIFCAVCIVVFLLVLTTAAIVTFILPESYASTARMTVEGSPENYGYTTGGQPGYIQTYDPYFIQTTFEIIQSELVLSNVVSTLDLNTKWGKRYNNGVPFKATESLGLLKRRMVLQPVRNTKIITITVYDEDRQEAADLANGIANSYQLYRRNSRRQLMTQGQQMLEQQFAESNAKILAAQTNLDYLHAQLKITDNDPNATSPTPSTSFLELQTSNQQLAEGERTLVLIQTQIDELKGLKKDKLRFVLPTMTGDANLTDLLNKLNVAMQALASLTNEYASTDLHIMRVKSTIEELNQEIDVKVAGIMFALDGEVKSKQAALEALRASLDKAKTDGEQEQARTQPYWDAKRELANMVDFNKQLAVKIETTKADGAMPPESLVQITDLAQPGEFPARPNKPLNIAIGAVAGVLLGSVAGGIAAVFAQRRSRLQAKPAA